MDATGDKRTEIRVVLTMKGGQERKIVRCLPNSNQPEKMGIKLCDLDQALTGVQADTNALLSQLVEEEKSRPNVANKNAKDGQNGK